VAQVQKTAASLQVELVLTTTNHSPETLVQKRIKINGVPRRAIDVIGQLNVVLFSPADIDLIGGAPSLRRRYLDITVSQFNHRYLRSLQRYNKVLQQRNHLLKLIAEHHANVDQLDFWDKELLEHGGYIAEQRLSAISDLNVLSQPIHHEISSGENLQINYVPSASEDFSEGLKRIRQEEIARGMSLMGPHRDDLKFMVNDSDIGIYGSRGQQRTVALSLRLAETRLLQSKTGEEPVMLLDDVLSELDATRRHHLLSSVSLYQQVLITTTDLDHFDPDFLSQSALFLVSWGNIAPKQHPGGH
jgi:DNA replication and repair protein RecF